MSAQETMRRALAPRLRPPIGSKGAGALDVAGIGNLRVIASNVRTWRLAAEASLVDAQAQMAKRRRELAEDLTTEKAVQAAQRGVSEAALIDVRTLRERAVSPAEVARFSHATYWNPTSWLARQPLKGRTGEDGKGPLLELLARLPEAAFLSRLQHFVDDRDFGAIGIAVVAKPEVLPEVLAATRGELRELDEAQALVASAVADSAEIEGVHEALAAGRFEPKSFDRLVRRQTALREVGIEGVDSERIEAAAGTVREGAEAAERRTAEMKLSSAKAALDQATHREVPETALQVMKRAIGGKADAHQEGK